MSGTLEGAGEGRDIREFFREGLQGLEEVRCELTTAFGDPGSVPAIGVFLLQCRYADGGGTDQQTQGCLVAVAGVEQQVAVAVQARAQ